jgi:hypothetical protein
MTKLLTILLLTLIGGAILFWLIMYAMIFIEAMG